MNVRTVRRRFLLSLRLAREWRPSVAWARSMFRSGATSFAVLAVTFWLLPGVWASGGPAALVELMVVLALIGMAMRWVLLGVAVLVGGIGVLALGTVLQAIVMYTGLRISDGVAVNSFVDAFPVLPTPEAIYDHLTDYMSQPGVRVPGFIDAAIKAGAIAKGMAAKAISAQIEQMAAKFIAGENAERARPTLERLWKDGIAFSVDLLGEACVSDAEADEYQKKYLDLIENLPGAVAKWSPDQRLESDHETQAHANDGRGPQTKPDNSIHWPGV